MRSFLCGLLLGGLLPTTIGCGLADYERRMHQVRRRLALQDEEDKLLGLPIDQPTVRDEKDAIDREVWPAESYLRLPRNYYSGLEKDAAFAGPELSLYRYDGPELHAVLVAAAPVGEGTKEIRGFSPDEFRRQVLQALRTYYWLHLRQRKSVLDFSDKSLEKTAITVPGGKKTLAFDTLSLGDDKNVPDKEAVHFHAYFHQDGKLQAAIVYQVPRSRKDDPAEARTRAASLATLAFGDEARRRRVVFLQRKR